MQNLQAIWPYICQALCASDIYRLKTISIVSQKRVSNRSSLDLLWISSQGFDLSTGGIFKRDMPRCRANIFNNVGNIRRPWPNWVQYLSQHKEFLNQTGNEALVLKKPLGFTDHILNIEYVSKTNTRPHSLYHYTQYQRLSG